MQGPKIHAEGLRAQWRAAEELIYKRQLTNGQKVLETGELSERQIVKLCD
jgi:Ni,Fe-hydrogenase III large subunit